MSEKIFDAEIPHLPQMLKWIRGELKSVQVPESIQKKMELAAEEALVNIIHHAYRSKGGKIFLDLNVEPGKVELIVVDQGPAFNPLHHATPKQIVPLHERKIGGLGILLMKECMDEIHYQRKGKDNHFKMVIEY